MIRIRIWFYIFIHATHTTNFICACSSLFANTGLVWSSYIWQCTQKELNTIPNEYSCHTGQNYSSKYSTTSELHSRSHTQVTATKSMKSITTPLWITQPPSGIHNYNKEYKSCPYAPTWLYKNNNGPELKVKILAALIGQSRKSKSRKNQNHRRKS